MEINGRFKDAPWYKSNPTILIGGVGGIGSSTLYCLSKSVPGTYYIVDPDNVEEHNVGTQFFKKIDIGKKKVTSLQKSMAEYTDSIIQPITTKIDAHCYIPIMISAFDNMEARKFTFELWKKQVNRELYIDGRLRASLYEIYVVIPGREEQYEATLFDDTNVDEGPCTFKQTAYFGMLIGARITQMVCNYLTNKDVGEEVCNLPFSIREIGDIVFMDVVNAKVEYNEIISL
jgi:molybdopterin/thiamine biosynthesis adenylyltransferase